MYNITEAEYHALETLYQNGPSELADELAEILIDKKLIDYREESYGDGYPTYSDDYVITNLGKVTYEDYSEHRSVLMTADRRAKTAAVISVISLVIAFTALLLQLLQLLK